MPTRKERWRFLPSANARGIRATIVMNILICNNRYFPSTGPEKYLFSVTPLLESHGHHVVPLAIAWEANEPTPYAHYFVSPPIDGKSVFFRQYRDRLTPMNQWRLFARAAYNEDAKAAAGRIIDAEKIDLLYVLHTVNMLSPSVIDAAAERHIPVVMRLSDFNLLCPAYLFLRDGKVCTECLGGLHHAIEHRCLQHSVAVTTARVMAMRVHQARGIYKRVNAFICPSRYMAEQMEHFAPARGKLHHIPSFVDLDAITPRATNQGYLLFFGRIARDKGLDVLLQAHALLAPSVPLIIAGTSTDSYRQELDELLAPHQRESVHFVGFKAGKDLDDLIDGAIATVVPSRWHDNSPMSVYESLAHGKPVVGSDMGGIAEQVTPDCGFLVPPDDSDALRDRLQRLIDDPALVTRMGHAARARAEAAFSPASHYDQLMRVFGKVG